MCVQGLKAERGTGRNGIPRSYPAAARPSRTALGPFLGAPGRTPITRPHGRCNGDGTSPVWLVLKEALDATMSV